MNTERLQKLQEYWSADPQDPFLIYAIAQEYDNGGSIQEAETWYKKLLTGHPDYLATYYHYGKLLENNARISEALGIFETGIQKAAQANDKHAWSELKEAFLQAGGEEEEF